MQRKRVTNAVLLTAVTLIWGIVAWRIWGGTGDDASDIAVSTAPLKVGGPSGIRPDTIRLLVDYRDPFLGTWRKDADNMGPRNGGNGGGKPKIVQETVPDEPETPWPEMKYLGLVENTDQHRKVGLLRIGGREHMIKKGDQVGEFLILDVQERLAKVQRRKEVKQYVL